jgi:uncharacterized protein YneF (UPF0154 family)
MWRKFSESILTIIVTVVLIGIIAGIFISRAVNQEQAALEPLREQNEALRAQIDETRRQSEAATQLLREAVAKREGEVFRPEEEIQRLNTTRMDALANAIAKKVAPELPAPKSADELAQEQDQEVQKIATATAEKLAPTFHSIGQTQREQASREIAQYRDKLDAANASLARTQAVADQALDLTRQLSKDYLQTYSEKGGLVRIFSLPGLLIQDVAKGNVINGNRDARREQQDLDAKINQIEQRLNQIRAEAANPLASNTR